MEKVCCSECKNFRRHYVKNSVYLQKTAWGHCTLNCKSNKKLRVITESNYCDDWAQAENQGEEENLIKALKRTGCRIDDVITLLEDKLNPEPADK